MNRGQDNSGPRSRNHIYQELFTISVLARQCHCSSSCEWIDHHFIFSSLKTQIPVQEHLFALVSCLLGSRKRQGGFALLVFIEGNELLLLTMKEVEWCTEKRKRKKVKENKSPLVWILGITITSFILLQRDKCNSVTIVWKGEVYMQGKFFFSGHGKLSVTTSYCGPFSNWALFNSTDVQSEYLERTDKTQQI